RLALPKEVPSDLAARWLPKCWGLLHEMDEAQRYGNCSRVRSTKPRQWLAAQPRSEGEGLLIAVHAAPWDLPLGHVGGVQIDRLENYAASHPMATAVGADLAGTLLQAPPADPGLRRISAQPELSAASGI